MPASPGLTSAAGGLTGAGATATPAQAAAQPTPVLGLPVQRRRRPPEDATAELVVGDDGLPRRSRQRHLAPQLRRPVDEPSGGFPAGLGTSPTPPVDPDAVRARMSALQAGTTRGRQESADAGPAAPADRPMWTPPPLADLPATPLTGDVVPAAGPADSDGEDADRERPGDATRALRIRRYTSPTTPAPADSRTSLAADTAGAAQGNGNGASAVVDPRAGDRDTGNGVAAGNGGGSGAVGGGETDTVSIEPRTGTGASGQLPDRTEGIGSATPPVPSHERPAPPAAGDRPADPATDGASQVKDPSGKDA
ncbi:hypothetical protein Air01nite_79760 [Asanoa iriomotensis]|uniref:Syndecan 1 n=1 Tax=Asanoa iriomotensis TaxID=234613 RepID=A0ABQ4CGJ1_9ACTN|nr:hypothetical protein Air01nite_79760 [Asanoa iriomotensis]